MKKEYYTVWVGYAPDVYNNWPDAKAQVNGYPGGRCAGFTTRLEAEQAFEAGYEKYMSDKEKKGKGGPSLF